MKGSTFSKLCLAMLNCSWKNPIKEMLQPLKKSFVIKRKFSLIAFEILWVLMILKRLNYALQFKLSGKLRHLNFPPWCGIISLTDLNPSSVPHISYHIHMQRALKLQQGIASPGLLSFGLLFSKGAVSNCAVFYWYNVIYRVVIKNFRFHKKIFNVLLFYPGFFYIYIHTVKHKQGGAEW